MVSALQTNESLKGEATIERSYEIVAGIYFMQDGYEFDLHNNFDFVRMDYSLEARRLLLFWECSNGNWVSSNTPKTLTIEFTQVSEFRFMPRDPFYRR